MRSHVILYIVRQGLIDDYFSHIRLGQCGVRDRNRKWKEEDQGKAKKVGGDAQIRARLWSGTVVGCGDNAIHRASRHGSGIECEGAIEFWFCML